MAKLFTPLEIKSIQFKNRIWVSPMCQYSSVDGYPNDWHFVHLGSRAVGGAGLVMVEATAVTPQGRISPDDCGLWSDNHTKAFKRITDFIKDQGAHCGIQLAHAGRKGSVYSPWKGGGLVPKVEGGWDTLAPSPIPFNEGNPPPKALTLAGLKELKAAFVSAARRAELAGFDVLELHMAHGYLLHEFLSPLSNQRQDNYGGNLENRMRFPLEVVAAVREVWPQDLPLFVRISSTDWIGGEKELEAGYLSGKNNNKAWNLSESIEFAHALKGLGVDLIDCSSGAILPSIPIPAGPGYQVGFAEAIRKKAKIMTGAVGLITEPNQAEAILVQNQADAIFIGREFLRNPYWPQFAAKSLRVDLSRPKQYVRA